MYKVQKVHYVRAEASTSRYKVFVVLHILLSNVRVVYKIHVLYSTLQYYASCRSTVKYESLRRRSFRR